ncbi:MAG: hypothetical protein Q4B70_19155 [Lachnospiraceae bacterium]|nr:hypothetical protein [Lachnospiraceae bacterium]
MSYEKKDEEEVVLLGYYNVWFYLVFRVGLDEYKKNIFVDQINNGTRMMMKDISEWCQNQHIQFKTKFIYRNDFSLMANLWNFYSYCRFRHEIKNKR